MKTDPRARLLPFYFGTLGESERLQTERLLLEAPDALLDYFDLKREIEAAEIIPAQPPARVWRRLSESVRRSPRRTFITVAFGLAVAASVAFCLFFFAKPKHTNATHSDTQEILFDPGRDLSGNSGVL